MHGLGLLLLRWALAAIFVAHGAHKLLGWWGGPGVGPGGLDATAQFLATAGLNPAFPLAVLVAIAEAVGGVLLAAGFLTRFVAPLLAIELGVAIWKVHLPWGMFLNWTGESGRSHGYEYALVLIGALLCLALTGAGEWSVDGRRENSAERRAAGRARLRGKL